MVLVCLVIRLLNFGMYWKINLELYIFCKLILFCNIFKIINYFFMYFYFLILGSLENLV